MKDFSSLLSAFANLLWPAAVMWLVWRLHEPLAELILSAKSRKFTLKIGGQELSMDEANAQQQKLIADLQSKVAELTKTMGIGSLGANQAIVARTDETPAKVLTSVLWVDDHPKNNSYFVEQLNQLGVRVDPALTTTDGLAMLGNRGYGAVISDMGRTENGHFNGTAGLDLLRAIRVRDPDVPVFFFCSTRAAEKHRSEAMQEKANGITSSPTELYALLNLDQLKPA